MPCANLLWCHPCPGRTGSDAGTFYLLLIPAQETVLLITYLMSGYLVSAWPWLEFLTKRWSLSHVSCDHVGHTQSGGSPPLHPHPRGHWGPGCISCTRIDGCLEQLIYESVVPMILFLRKTLLMNEAKPEPTNSMKCSDLEVKCTKTRNFNLNLALASRFSKKPVWLLSNEMLLKCLKDRYQEC